jgi:hypothetical protein
MSTAECPICGRPPEPKFRPFCSKRCADVDLARWFTGVYAIPGAPVDEEEDVPTPPREPLEE